MVRSLANLLLWLAFVTTTSIAQESPYQASADAPEHAWLVEQVEVTDGDTTADQRMWQRIITRLVDFYEKRTSPEIREAFTFLQEAIEKDALDRLPDTGKAKSFASSINPVRVAMRAYNVYQVGVRNTKYQNVRHLIPDIVALTVATHTFEATFVLWAPGLAQWMGASPEFVNGLRAVGLTMIIPGDWFGMPVTEPVCWAGRCAYLFSSKFRSFVRVAANAGRRLIKPLAPVSDALLRSAETYSVAQLETSIENYSPTLTSKESDGRFTVRLAGAGADLTFTQNAAGEVHLTAISLKRGLSTAERANAGLFAMFGRRRSRTLREISVLEENGRLDLLKEAFYVEGFDLTAEQATLKLRQGVFQLPKAEHEAILSGCQKAF